MPIITKLEYQKNNEERANLYLDDKFYTGISVELCIKEHLKSGVEIDLDKLNELILEDEKGVAFTKAINYVSNNYKTTKQVKDYLCKRGYAKNTIEHVINKMNEYKYLDDEGYAKQFVLTYSKKYGKLKLISGLRSKGISDKIIDELFSEENDIEYKLEEVANKYLKNKILDDKTYIKLSRFLYSRGFEFDDINRYVNNLKKG